MQTVVNLVIAALVITSILSLIIGVIILIIVSKMKDPDFHDEYDFELYEKEYWNKKAHRANDEPKDQNF